MGVDVADDPTQPPFHGDLLWLTGVPDIHGPEVRTVGVGIANAVDHSHLALVKEVFERA